MKNRVSMVMFIIFGSFCVYCVENGAQQVGARRDRAAGPVALAVAQSSPGAPHDSTPGPTILFDEVVTPTTTSGSCLSPEIDISDFRMVVVHRSLTDNFIELKLGESTGFVPLVFLGGNTRIHTIDPQLGQTLRFSWARRLAGTCDPHAFTVVGYGATGRGAVVSPPGSMAGGR